MKDKTSKVEQLKFPGLPNFDGHRGIEKLTIEEFLWELNREIDSSQWYFNNRVKEIREGGPRLLEDQDKEYLTAQVENIVNAKNLINSINRFFFENCTYSKEETDA